MIKVFRNIRRKLLAGKPNHGMENQPANQTSQYLKYAIGEIVLVVIGILLALQVNEWNTDRHKRKAGQSMVTQLQVDLKKSQEELEEVREFYLERAVLCAQVLRAFWTEERPEDIADSIGGGTSNRIYSPILGTARSLINSGKIELIPSDEIRNGVIAYVEKVDDKLKDISRYEETYYRKGVELIREAFPNTLQSTDEFNKSLREEVDSERWVTQVNLDVNRVPPQVDKVPFRSDLNELFQDERFFRGYSMLHLSHRNIYFRYGEILEVTDELLAEIEKITMNQ